MGITEEERRKLIFEGLKEDVVKLKETGKSLEYKCEECKKISLDSVYERRDIQDLEILESLFKLLTNILRNDIFAAVEILVGKDPQKFVDIAFYRNEKLLLLMEELGVIASAKQVLRIVEFKEKIEQKYLFCDRPKFYQDIFAYSEELFKIVEKALKVVTSEYLAAPPE